MQISIQGREAYCYTGGKPFDAALPTIVFIHGAQHDHSVWNLQARFFAHHGFNALAVDLPGHGRSDGPALTSVESMAHWLIALLDACEIPQAILVGHSMGSLVALEACSQAPERVARLALLGTAFPMKVSGALLDAALHDVQKAIDMVNIWSHSGFVHKPSSPGPGFDVLAMNRRLMQHIARRNSEPVFYRDFCACNDYANGEAAARTVRCPVLFMLGGRDMMTPPKAAAALIHATPQARTVVLDNCGHAMMAEQSDAVTNNLYAFAG